MKMKGRVMPNQPKMEQHKKSVIAVSELLDHKIPFPTTTYGEDMYRLGVTNSLSILRELWPSDRE